MKTTHTLQIAGSLICNLSLVASSGEYHVGPIAFTNDTPFDYPQFSPTTGYLHAIAFESTNCARSYEVICDNDSVSDLIWPGDGFAETFFLKEWPTSSTSRSYWLVTTPLSFMQGVFTGVDDGDRLVSHTRDGGLDELTYSFAYSNLAHQPRETISNALILSEHTGYSSKSAFVYASRTAYLHISPNIPVEQYITNIMYSGQCYIHYYYEATPLRPSLADISLSNTELRVNIQNISLSSSNTVQRSFDLLSDEWTDVGIFLSNGWKTNWSENVSNEWKAVFYRVLSE